MLIFLTTVNTQRNITNKKSILELLLENFFLKICERRGYCPAINITIAKTFKNAYFMKLFITVSYSR